MGSVSKLTEFIGYYHLFPKTSKHLKKIKYCEDCKKRIFTKSIHKSLEPNKDIEDISVFDFIMNLLRKSIKFDLTSYLMDCVRMDYLTDDEVLEVLELDQSGSCSFLDIDQISTNDTTLVEFCLQHSLLLSIDYLISLGASLGSPNKGLLTQHRSFLSYLLTKNKSNNHSAQKHNLKIYLRYVLDHQEEIKEFLEEPNQTKNLLNLTGTKKSLKKITAEVGELAKEDS